VYYEQARCVKMTDEKPTIEDLEYAARLRTWLETVMKMPVKILSVKRIPVEVKPDENV
jgi:hypothetical protein